MCVWRLRKDKTFLRVVLVKQKDNNKDEEGSGRSDLKWCISPSPGREGLWSRGSQRGTLPWARCLGQELGRALAGGHMELSTSTSLPGQERCREGAAVLRHFPCLSLSHLPAKHAGRS